VGTAARSLVAGALAALVALAIAPGTAAADDACVGRDRHGTFAICFDLGNRLRLDASTAGIGGAIELRHRVVIDRDVSWRIEHQMAEVEVALDSGQLGGALYRGRYLRHARDGHVVLPLGLPRKVFLPFDLGAEAEVGHLRWLDADHVELVVIRSAALFELSRADDFGHRAALALVSRWNLLADPHDRAISEHQVAPFSLAAFDLYGESRSGLTRAGLHVEGGALWSTTDHWRRALGGDAIVERVIVALNDRPLSLFATARYDLDDGLSAVAGVRFAPLVGGR
jgi:hypothetical protein